jgi:hypothetical protein
MFMTSPGSLRLVLAAGTFAVDIDAVLVSELSRDQACCGSF